MSTQTQNAHASPLTADLSNEDLDQLVRHGKSLQARAIRSAFSGLASSLKWGGRKDYTGTSVSHGRTARA